jgi:catechol 2,3-dioxygenase-like lactoylglutathione lyase family enzyme
VALWDEPAFSDTTQRLGLPGRHLFPADTRATLDRSSSGDLGLSDRRTGFSGGGVTKRNRGGRVARRMATEVRFVYSGLRVRSLRRSLTFYKGLGFRVVKRGGFSHGGKYVHLTLPNSPHRLELNFYPRGTAFFEPVRRGGEFDHFGFYAADVSRWLRTAERAGAEPMVDYVDGSQRLIFVRDPDGVWLGVYGPLKVRPPSRRRGGRPGSARARPHLTSRGTAAWPGPDAGRGNRNPPRRRPGRARR